MGTVAKVNGVAVASISKINGIAIGSIAAIWGQTIPAANPSAIVSGAGTPEANGTYTFRGMFNGFPYYNLLGQPDSTANSAIIADIGGAWLISSSSGDDYYDGLDIVAFPWLTAYAESTGNFPAPTVTQG